MAASAAGLRADVSFAVIDGVLVILSYMAAVAVLVIDIGHMPADYTLTGFLLAAPGVVAVHILANLFFGAYGHIWEHASVAEAMKIAVANIAAAGALGVATQASRQFGTLGPIPLQTILIGSMMALGGMGLVRFRSRLFSFQRFAGMEPARALVVGTGRAAAEVARHGSSPDHPMHVVGFLATGSHASGRRLAGRPVYEPLADLPSFVDLLEVDEVIIAARVGAAMVRELVDRCMDIEVRLRIVPDLAEVLDGGGSRTVRDLELTDLLSRPEVSTDLQQVAGILEGKRVLVTGAGGSIGSEITRQVLQFGPSLVLALDNDETHLHDAMRSWDSPSQLKCLLADIRDQNAVERLFALHRPDVVFHAAAHKHVPILESASDEAVKTNITGTAVVMEACDRFGTERFILISTDKAVAPSSVMGATKRVAEMMVQAAAGIQGACTHTAVRFGNVLGSRGSVVPTFMDQIERGGPVTVSDPQMTRYFMTVDEAVQLVLQTAALAKGGELFVLDMGEPVKIIDLAHRMIRLAGLVPGRDIDVVVTGRRAGEKLEEALSRAPLRSSPHPNIRIALDQSPPPATLSDAVGIIEKLAEEGELDELREVLADLAGQAWDSDEVVDLRELEAGVAID